MRKSIRAVVAAAILSCTLSVSAEHAMALEASQGQYAVIAPIFTGTNGNTSYLRLVNNAGSDADVQFTSTTYSISVVGSPSGTVYGTARIDVPAHASPQYSITEILSAANVAGLAGGDTAYSLYVQTPHNGTGFMHVVYNDLNKFFENVSTCQAYVQADTRNKYLFNVHTTRLAAYPNQIYIHNYAAVPLAFRVTVRDSRTGTLIGTVPVAINANATTSMPFSDLEQRLGWTPEANQPHANVMVEAVGVANAPALVGSFIYNQVLDSSLSMAAICKVNDIVVDGGDGGTGGGSGGGTGVGGGGGGGGSLPFALTVTKSGAGSGTVTSSPTGIDCGALCPSRAFDFNAGATVTLTASAANGSSFQGWGGACSGTGPCNVTMDAAKSVTATFAVAANTLTVSRVGNGNVTSLPAGINCGNVCTASFGFGNTATLTAVAGNGATFQGWSGACSGIGACSVVVIGAQSVTATFSN